MKEKHQRQMYDYFLENRITNFIGVPDSTLRYFIDQGLKRKKLLIVTKEDEAIGIATGMLLSSSYSLVFMQNAGFANSISTITSLIQLYEIPLIFLIGWRGYLKKDAPEHTKIGKIQPKLIESLELESKIVGDNNWKKCCDWAIKKIQQNIPCVLIIKNMSL